MPMFDENTPTRDLPWPRRGSWIGVVEKRFPTLGHLRHARKADINTLPLCGPAAVRHVEDMLNKFPNVGQRVDALLAPVYERRYRDAEKCLGQIIDAMKDKDKEPDEILEAIRNALIAHYSDSK